MSEPINQPEALRLADALDDEFVSGRISNDTGRKAAAELRRLHGEVERLRSANEATRNAGFVEASRIHGKEIERLRALYNDLIMCVGNKYPGESRHETAKRYIHRAEHMIAHEVDAALKEPK